MFIKNDSVVLRTIHGSIFLIDISDNYSGDKCSLYEINETGRFLWDAVAQNRTIDELVGALQNAIIDEVSRDVLLNDVTEYINDLIGKRFISEVAANG
ncbi:MAG: PqqD family protein [Ruminiclostridium sp.]|nr:PqqD family protein [Ruminiclostridium sp.]